MNVAAHVTEGVPNCPPLKSTKKRNVVSGSVNGVPCRILIDSGADIAMVPRSLVGFDCEDGGAVRITGAVGMSDGRDSTKTSFVIN